MAEQNLKEFAISLVELCSQNKAWIDAHRIDAGDETKVMICHSGLMTHSVHIVKNIDKLAEALNVPLRLWDTEYYFMFMGIMFFQLV